MRFYGQEVFGVSPPYTGVPHISRCRGACDNFDRRFWRRRSCQIKSDKGNRKAFMRYMWYSLKETD